MGGGGEGRFVTIKWPENGSLTLEWVQELGKTLEFASRELQPTELPNVLPVSVIDSLLLAAHKVDAPASSLEGVLGVGDGGGCSMFL